MPNADICTYRGKLGFDVGPLDHFKYAIKKPYGMVLVTGPTGSGKTTTLYSALSELNTSLPFL